MTVDSTAAETALVRIWNTVHVRGCWHTRRSDAVLSWKWAEDKSVPVEIAPQAILTRLRFCSDCRPIRRTCGALGPLGTCDRPHGHAGAGHSWLSAGGASASWNGTYPTEVMA